MPADFISSLFVFILSAFLGFEVIKRVSPLLHTPLTRAWTAASSSCDTPDAWMTSGLRTRAPSSPTAPMPSSGWNGTPSLRTTMTSSGAPSACATWATRTPPRGRPRTTTGSPRRCPSRAESRRPASSRSANTMTAPFCQHLPGQDRQGPWSGFGDQSPYRLTRSRHCLGAGEVRTMAGLMRREPRGEAAETPGRFDRLFDEWTRMMPFRPMAFPLVGRRDLIRVEEYRGGRRAGGRADLPGIDPDKDVELTVSDGMLHIGAERREEEKREEKGYLRREVRYGSFSGHCRSRRAWPKPTSPRPTRMACWRSASRNRSTKRPRRSPSANPDRVAALACAEPQRRGEARPARRSAKRLRKPCRPDGCPLERCRPERRRRPRPKQCATGSPARPRPPYRAGRHRGRVPASAGKAGWCPGARSRRSPRAC